MKTKQELELEKLQVDGMKWYAEDGKTIEYKLTEDLYQLEQDIAKKVNQELELFNKFQDITYKHDEAPSYFLPCGGDSKGFRLWVLNEDGKGNSIKTVYVLEFVCFDYLPEGKELFRTNDIGLILNFTESI
mgnify:FL=1